jgi:hypothetical protein
MTTNLRLSATETEKRQLKYLYWCLVLRPSILCIRNVVPINLCGVPFPSKKEQEIEYNCIRFSHMGSFFNLFFFFALSSVGWC